MENIKQQAPPDGQGTRWKKWTFLLIVVLIILVAVCAGMICHLSKTKGEQTLERELTAELGIMPGMSEDEIRDRLNRKVAESMLNISINPVPEFADGKSAGNLQIENIPGNNYAFTVEVIRNDTKETILKTGLIDPGYYVKDIALDTELPKGEYVCLAKFTAYAPDTGQEIGQAGTQIVIKILN